MLLSFCLPALRSASTCHAQRHIDTYHTSASQAWQPQRGDATSARPTSLLFCWMASCAALVASFCFFISCTLAVLSRPTLSSSA